MSDYVRRVERHQASPLWKQLAWRTGIAVPLRRGMTVLDYGCGTGAFTRALVTTGARVTGYDSDPAMIARARQIDSTPGRYTSEFPGTTFDGAYLLNVIGHVTEGEHAVGDLIAGVHPGGFVVVLNPNRWHYRARWLSNVLRGYRSDPTIVRRYTPAELHALMRAGGLTLVKEARIGERYLGQYGMVLAVYAR